MALHEHAVTVNGLPVRYWGDGEDNNRAILLIHGGLTDARLSWSAVIPALAEDYRVIAPDLPGFGKSAQLPDMSMTAICDWIKALLDALNIDQAVMVGSSFGALFTRLFAATYPGYVPAVIMVNGGSLPRISPLVRTMAGLPVIGSILFTMIGRETNSRPSLERMIHVKEALTDELVRMAAANNAVFSQILRQIALHSIPEKRTPPVPTLLLWGENDALTTMKEGERIKASIPGAKLNRIESCGHLPQLEAPEVFVWQIKQFLAELDRPRRSQGAGMLPPTPRR